MMSAKYGITYTGVDSFGQRREFNFCTDSEGCGIWESKDDGHYTQCVGTAVHFASHRALADYVRHKLYHEPDKLGRRIASW